MRGFAPVLEDAAISEAVLRSGGVDVAAGCRCSGNGGGGCGYGGEALVEE